MDGVRVPEGSPVLNPTSSDVRASGPEDHFRLIADALPALISYIAADTRYVFANKAYEKWFGRRAENVVGRTMADVLGGEAFEKLLPHVERVLRGERVAYVAEVPYRSGTRWIDATYVPDRGADGRVRGFYVLVLDVSEKVLAERALRESEERFRNMADHAPVMVWVSEADGVCSYRSKSWSAFTGQPPESGVGQGWLDAVHPDDREETRRAFRGAHERKEPFRVEYRLRREDGGYAWALDAATPRFTPGGAFHGHVGSVIDISERKLAEEEIRQRVRERTAELEDTVRELDTFAYTVSHDLRAPLRAIHRYSDILLEETAPKLLPEEVESLERIRRGAARMDELIQDLLAYSRISRSTIIARPTDVAAVLEEAAAALHVKPRIDGPLPRALGDRVLLSQCLTNLLSNAFKFTDAGRPPEVVVSAERRGDFLRVRIRDNGIGVDPSHQGRLFGLFERLHPAAYPGTGVGLAIVKKAMERMGGRVGMESLPGQGSVFWIDLKAADAG